MLAAVIATATLGLAIVTQDQTPLRAAPTSPTTTQALLWPGDVVEVRGERLDHLQVYDHQRERGGFVRATQLRPLGLQEADAPALLAVLRFLRDTPGAEPLGLAYAAAYLKAAPASAINAEPFDALGGMAERLARRASSRSGKGSDTVAAHLEVAARHGLKFSSFERDGAMQLCYDGEAFRRVLALPAQAEQMARAVLALTRHDCIDPQLPASQKQQLDRWRAEVLERVTPAITTALSEPTRNRLRLRRAGVWSALAFVQARSGAAGVGAAQATERRALAELAAINKSELTDDDQADYAQAAVRVGAARWAAAPATAPATPATASAAGRVAVHTQPGEPGQTCVLLTEASHGPKTPPQTQPQTQPQASLQTPLLRRCTYASVWLASARLSPDGRTLVLAVQPLESWLELWVFRASATGWQLDVLPPAATDPGLGYVEFAGWVAGTAQMLLAREARVEGRMRRSFELLDLDTLNVTRQATAPQSLTPFYRWQDALWKQQTVSLR